MKLNRAIVVESMLKLQTLSIGAIMFLMFKLFSDSAVLGDPIYGGPRAWWAFAAIVATGFSIASVFSDKKIIRFLGLFTGGVVIFSLGVTYVIVLPAIKFGTWIALALGTSQMAAGAVVYWLPEKLNDLIDLNDGIKLLESNISILGKELNRLETEVISLKQRILEQDGA